MKTTNLTCDECQKRKDIFQATIQDKELWQVIKEPDKQHPARVLYKHFCSMECIYKHYFGGTK